MDTIKNDVIVAEYEESLAAKVAEMWNKSRDGWGGDTRVMTPEQVKLKEANAGNIVLYLALDGEDVVGYCSMSQYREDVGALYIPLLNVRPDYHGKKIGKLLMKRAVEKTVELGWPRLDLFTWPGNLKAVPLYKKCGFFWEDRDDTTHLMNFIPAVVGMPLLKQYFNQLDWYDDSIRPIEVKPDGTRRNGFTFYEYQWQKGDTQLKVQLEKSGRGISAIETNEFKLELVLPNHEVIEGQEQEVQLICKSKTDRKLHVCWYENHHERAVLELEETEMIVEKETVLKGTVHFLPGEEPSPWSTHPYVSVNCVIDGMSCTLKLGVFPKQPAHIAGSASMNLAYIGKTGILELEIGNNLGERASLLLRFPKSGLLRLEKMKHQLSLDAKERKLVKIPFTVMQHGFYQPIISVEAISQDGKALVFENRNVGIPLKGIGKKFGGESKEYWHLYNGISQVDIRKLDHLAKAGRKTVQDDAIVLYVPKLGKPYSSEFSKKKPFQVHWEEEKERITLQMDFQSEEMPGVVLRVFTALYGEGLIQRWAEILNDAEDIEHHVFFQQPLYQQKKEAVFPLKGGVVEYSASKELDFGDIYQHQYDGNWFFSKNGSSPIGVSWSPGYRPIPDGWQLILDYDAGKLLPGEKVLVGPCYISIGAFQTWQEMQAFAEESELNDGAAAQQEKALLLSSEFTADGKLMVQLKTNRTSFLDGKLQVKINDGEALAWEIAAAEEKTECSVQIAGNVLPITAAAGTFMSSGEAFKLEALQLFPQGDVRGYEQMDGKLKQYVLNNGPLELKAASDYAKGLISLKLDGEEWLDSAYPERLAKSWWNPWLGGIKTVPAGVSTLSLIKAEAEVQFTDLTDNHGRVWKALELTTKLDDHDRWGNLVFSQFYALMPGVPVLAHFARVIDHAGRSFSGASWITDGFLKGESLTELSLADQRSATVYKGGAEEQCLYAKTGDILTSRSRQEKLYLIHKEQLEVYMNSEVLQFAASSRALRENPLFLLFDKRAFSAELVSGLHNITFERSRI